MNPSNIDSAAWEDAIVEKCQTDPRLKPAWDLALETEDEELFTKVWQEATRFVVDDVLAGLIDQGLVEVAGMQDGDMTFSLTKAGHEVAEERRGNAKS